MAIGNLRDKLLKAGLVDKKQKQQADTEDRRSKKQKSAAELAAEEAERQRRFEMEKAREAEEQRQKEAERAAERARHELENRVRNICDRWAVRSHKPGQRRFYFVKRTSHIGHLLINDAFYDQLLLGALCIVERPAEEDTHVLLPPDAAERVEELDAAAVRFWARSARPVGYIAEPAP
jgi:uncharacterized protein YaiL (DUF2058 family)